MESVTQARRRLHAAGIDVQSDNGGGYGLYRDRQRIGRVFSDAGLIDWREAPKGPEPTQAACWPEESAFPLTKWVHGRLCWLVFGTAAAGCPIYEPEPELLAIVEAATPMSEERKAA